MGTTYEPFGNLEILHDRCAGLDVHKKTVVACVLRSGRAGVVERATKSFSTMTGSLEALASWLTEQGCTHVAMEATGAYWKPVVRHEALFDRERMKEPLLEAVAAASRSWG